MAMKMRPWSSPRSKTVMMLGWLSRAADCASRRNRLRASLSAETLPEMVLTASRRFSRGSWALNTSPIAPWPIFPTIWYLPIFSRSIALGPPGPAGPTGDESGPDHIIPSRLPAAARLRIDYPFEA